MVSLSDPRLEQLAKLAGSERIVRSQIEFVDVAGSMEISVLHPFNSLTQD